MVPLRQIFAALCCVTLPLLSSSFAFQSPISIQPFRNAATTTTSSTTQLNVKTRSAKARMSSRWYPGVIVDNRKNKEDIEEECLTIVSNLIRTKLYDMVHHNVTYLEETHAYNVAKGRFRDLAMTVEGFEVLESLFLDVEAEHLDDTVIYGCIYALQSLCVTGTLVGVKGGPGQQQKRVQHLRLYEWRDNPLDIQQELKAENKKSNNEYVKRLKYNADQTAGIQLMAKLQMKRTTQGVMDLLVALGVWTKHEDLMLLRSGFPVTFTTSELKAATDAEEDATDVDALLGIRKDLTHQKVYTIDSVTTSEVDDGLSVEELKNEDGSSRYKFWIHIADADQWAPRDSDAFQIALARTTTHYLPTGAIPMFPSSLSTGVMSLRANTDTSALSLGVELNEDGSIDVESLEMTQSTVRVAYRLSYDEVDDMLMEGVGYKEEWQLGALMDAAIKRKNYRKSNGSTDDMIPLPIPRSQLSVYEDADEPDGLGIKISIEAANNSGRNNTAESSSGDSSDNVIAASDSNLLVTELMVLAGEALGKWKLRQDMEAATYCGRIENTLDLPFRAQPQPDYWAREKEYKMLRDLLEHKHGYCHAWYARRFLLPVAIGPLCKPHFGLGVDCYIQWTSPIRRFGDLQVHSVVKRYLRRRRIHDMLFEREPLPDGLKAIDLGCPVPESPEAENPNAPTFVDGDVDYNWGTQLIPASRGVQRQAQQYWLYEHLSRQVQNDDPPTFEGIVLGCVDPERQQYAVYLPEIGYEHRYLSQKGFLDVGEILQLKVESVNPRQGLMTLGLINV